MSGPERDWHFRLSVFYAEKDVDSNRFMCRTPMGKLNSVTIEVIGEKDVKHLIGELLRVKLRSFQSCRLSKQSQFRI